ncbi:DNA-directed RNA polymerase subunit N [Candidatus Parvarchaeota archaeon]|nr:DNA-directed RNA polymerase subunit N [Candidatus Acidifodinimicrobium mancum]
MIPMRCYSCGKPLSNLWEEYKEKIKTESPKQAMDELGLDRYCCRATMLSAIEEQDIINFSELQ